MTGKIPFGTFFKMVKSMSFFFGIIKIRFSHKVPRKIYFFNIKTLIECAQKKKSRFPKTDFPDFQKRKINFSRNFM